MPADPARFEWAGRPRTAGVPIIFLGLGPEPGKLPEWFNFSESEDIRFIECPSFAAQLPGWSTSLPKYFTRMPPEEFTAQLAASASVVRYLPVQRAFPSFFAPLTARLALGAQPKRLERTVWIPSGENDLLCRELTDAFRDANYTVRLLDSEALARRPGEQMPRLLKQGAPDLFLSVNFKGLDPFGLGYAMLREAGVATATWLVDNPFNLLPAIKSTFWRDIPLFVTDHTFIPVLKANGAQQVTHLPLAASPKLFSGGSLPDHGYGLNDRLVFVGRSSFPNREKFFAGLHDVTSADSNDTATRRHFLWWQKELGIEPLWPDNEVRRIAAAAESNGLAWKLDCLSAAGPVTIFGDEGWSNLANADLRPVVDYYAHLPAIYRESAAVLNVTGMQLPGGLTQRHFDVWCAGGFLLTDRHAGLDIFPEDLTAPISFSSPDAIRPLFHKYQKESAQKQTLRQAWRELILRKHTYTHRVQAISTALGLS